MSDTKSQITRVKLSTVDNKDDLILSGYISYKDGCVQISVPVPDPEEFIKSIDIW